jgi:hypothetical protein
MAFAPKTASGRESHRPVVLLLFHPSGDGTSVYADLTVLISAHPPPYGPTGLVLFAGVVILLMRSHHLVSQSAPHPIPA